ncbi:MAG: transglycosylase domain-containing protein [Leptospiraceae bacterium]|nr:transglycosylase domain-containing protein [Leptospiraceae bacterium]
MNSKALSVKIDRSRAQRIPGVLLACITVVLLFWPPDAERLRLDAGAPILLSSEGQLLREFRERRSGSFQRWRALNAFPPRVVDLVLYSEDSRFYYHPGVDPIAIGRAMYANIRARQIIAGGSTITQQVVRMQYDDILPTQGWLRKPLEALLAVKLEMFYSKDELLEVYLNRIPLRNNRRGLSSGAMFVFQRDLDHLSESELAALIVLIRGGHMSRERFSYEYRRLLGRMQDDGKLSRNISDSEIAASIDQIYSRIPGAVETDTNRMGSLHADQAPHFSAWLRERYPRLSGKIHTSISSQLNHVVGDIVQNELRMIENTGASQAAVVVIEILPPEESGGNAPRPVLRALVGSRNFSDPEGGQVNAALAVRTAGSTLKPFIYARAMDRFGLRPYTLLEDTDISLPLGDGGSYRPRNYDLDFWGEISLAEALATSRNIPAVELTRRLGEADVYQLFERAHLSGHARTVEEYGPGIALGTAGVRLIDLTHAYSTFATGGVRHPLYIGNSEHTGALSIGRREELFSEGSAFRIADILSRREERQRSFGRRTFLNFPFRVAAKTGTSRDYHDAWTVGFTPRHVVGVWVGRMDNAAMERVSGSWGAGRIFHQVMRQVTDARHSTAFRVPDNWRGIYVCRQSGMRAGPYCPAVHEYLAPDEEPPPLCNRHAGADQMNSHESVTERFSPERPGIRLASPVSEQVYFIDPHTPLEIQRIPVQAHIPSDMRPKPRLTYRLDDGPERNLSGFGETIEPQRGRHELVLYMNGIEMDRVRFVVQ